MAKKKKSRSGHSPANVKRVNPSIPQQAAESRAAAPKTAASMTAAPKSAYVPRRVIDDETFNPDYTPIRRDLKRIGSLAGIFFVVLIVLSFIL